MFQTLAWVLTWQCAVGGAAPLTCVVGVFLRPTRGVGVGLKLGLRCWAEQRLADVEQIQYQAKKARVEVFAFWRSVMEASLSYVHDRRGGGEDWGAKEELRWRLSSSRWTSWGEQWGAWLREKLGVEGLARPHVLQCDICFKKKKFMLGVTFGPIQLQAPSLSTFNDKRFFWTIFRGVY